jgi:Fe-S cluster biogenesis protein NfuA
MFIQTEATPNPSTLKFIPGRTVLDEGTFDCTSAEQAERSPLAARLFEVEGVSGVFFSRDYISVTVRDKDWAYVKPSILGAIMEHFMSGAPVLLDEDAALQSHSDDGESFREEDRQTVETIKELLDTRVRPAVAQDGGDITFKGYEDGVVLLTMRGACSGCPSSTMTLKHGIENLLKHFLPEVKEVRPVMM